MTTKRLSIILIVLFGISLICMSAKDTSGEESVIRCKAHVKCTLHIDQKKDGIWVKLNFLNGSNCDIELREDHLLTDGKLIHNGIIHIRRDSRKIPFKGKIIENPYGSYYVLRSQEKLEKTIKLNDYYDLSRPGRYQVFYETENYKTGGILYDMDIGPIPAGNLFVIRSNTVQFTVRE